MKDVENYNLFKCSGEVNLNQNWISNEIDIFEIIESGFKKNDDYNYCLLTNVNSISLPCVLRFKFNPFEIQCNINNELIDGITFLNDLYKKKTKFGNVLFIIGVFEKNVGKVIYDNYGMTIDEVINEILEKKIKNQEELILKLCLLIICARNGKECVKFNEMKELISSKVAYLNKNDEIQKIILPKLSSLNVSMYRTHKIIKKIIILIIETLIKDSIIGDELDIEKFNKFIKNE